jgi:hypothetical protein
MLHEQKDGPTVAQGGSGTHRGSGGMTTLPPQSTISPPSRSGKVHRGWVRAPEQRPMEEALSCRGMGPERGRLEPRRGSGVVLLDHQLQGLGLVFEKVSKVQFIWGQ